MNIYIVIPAHNEEAFLAKMLYSITQQTLPAKQIIVVNDNSTDNTLLIAEKFREQYDNLHIINTRSGANHIPGSKIIEAFYKGFEILDNDFDIICKFDADLIFPENYLETIATIFESDPKTGMASGILHIQKDEVWNYENIADKDHIRGPIKAYRKTCFEDIRGLKKSIGWDTLDVLLSQYHGWKVKTDINLIVKHLKPTGQAYHSCAKLLQGEAMYKMRYGLWITLIASIKLALLKRQPKLIKDYLAGYFKAKKEKKTFLVSPTEGKFIRNLRWKKMKKKLI